MPGLRDTDVGAAIATVLRNEDGTIEFPSEIPPAVEFPVTTPGGTSKLVHTKPQEKRAEDIVQEPKTPGTEGRPVLQKPWQTERPQAATRISMQPNLRRQGTNISALNEAIWSHPLANADESSSSSSSSSEEDEEEVEMQEKRRLWARRRAAHATAAAKAKEPSVKSKRHHNPYSRFNVGNENFKTKGKVSRKDGRLNISVNETSNNGYLAKALGAGLLKNMKTQSEDQDTKQEHLSQSTSKARRHSDVSTASTVTGPPRPKLNIVVMVIGSRGDIQPFLRLGKILKEEYGHRVRIATHPAFRDFVQKDSGLDFFSVGGDPSELMAFMVKNPGMIPKMETIRAGEIGRRRDAMAEMFQGFWRACINATDDEHDINNLKMMGDKNPFVADAIIANPPCFAHIHCAERLGVPLHLMFTFPYTPTQAFPHPLANIKKTNVDPGYTNFMSYPLVEMMTWQGLGDLVNTFRVQTLGLEPVSTLWAPGQLYRLKVPYTYLWSPGLVPKPEDWGPEIDIAGFVFLDLASTFDPPEDLVKFLDDGEPPVYIGFGSIVVDDPDRFTKMIFEAVEMAGVRALVSKGWGGLGDDNTPDNVYMLENTPHDWLFPKVKAVVHHGGAGTTAIGLKCGRPTMIVPFFGDQQFWGSMIARAGAGADPVQYKDLTAEKLAEGIKVLLTEGAATAAGKMAQSIADEGDGARNAVKSFHRALTLRGEHSMRCSILEDRVAVWTLKNTNLRLSALAADILVEKRKVSWKQLRLIRHDEWNDFEGPGEPLTGGATAIAGSLTAMAAGVGSIPFKITKHTKRRQRHEEKKKRKQAQKEAKRMQKGKGRGKGAEKQVNGENLAENQPEGQTTGVIDMADQEHGAHSSSDGGLRMEKASVSSPGPDTSSSTTRTRAATEGGDPIDRSTKDMKLPNGLAQQQVDDAKTHDIEGNREIPDSHAPNKMNEADSKTPAVRDDRATAGADSGEKSQTGVLKEHEHEKDAAKGDGNEVDKNHDSKDNDDEFESVADNTDSVMSADPEQGAIEETARDIGSGLGKTGEALASAPLDLTLAVVQGFHNAPRLYGDQTVRRQTRVTGIHSGLKAAREEFVYGIYDGFSGLVTQPYNGAKDGGPVGFIKGVGMGLTGFVLKDLAAIFGPFGYTAKGIRKQVERNKQPTRFIRKARIIEGQKDLRILSPEDKKATVEVVIHGWDVVQQVWALVEGAKSEGLISRVKMMHEHKMWRANGVFENVAMAEKALKARNRGEPLDQIFEEQRRQLREAEKPRRGMQQDIEERKESQEQKRARKIAEKAAAEASGKKSAERTENLGAGKPLSNRRRENTSGNVNGEMDGGPNGLQNGGPKDIPIRERPNGDVPNGIVKHNSA